LLPFVAGLEQVVWSADEHDGHDVDLLSADEHDEDGVDFLYVLGFTVLACVIGAYLFCTFFK
jgi:hypothetical protein